MTDEEKRDRTLARVVQLLREAEQALTFLRDTNTLARRANCFDYNGRFGSYKELLFRGVDTLADDALALLHQADTEGPDDIPF